MKILGSLYVHIFFFVIFEVYRIAFRYNICPKKYTDLLLRLVNGTTSSDTKPMKRTKKKGSGKKI